MASNRQTGNNNRRRASVDLELTFKAASNVQILTVPSVNAMAKYGQSLLPSADDDDDDDDDDEDDVEAEAK